MVTDHLNYLTFEDPAAVNLVRRALKLAQAGDLYGAAETASVDVGHAAVVSEGLRRGMRFSIGAELDNDPRARPDAQNIVDAMRPDAMLRSVHFITIEHPTSGPNFSWAFDNPEFLSLFEHVGTERTWQLYMEALLKAVDELPGHIIAHFFVPATFGHWPDAAVLNRYEDQIVAAARAKGMAIEFNTRFLYRDHTPEEKQRYLEANKRLLRKCRDAGVVVSVGSDAHSPKDQGGAFDIVLDVLDELEINEIAFAVNGRMARVALRVVQPEPPPPPEPEKRVAARGTRKVPVLKAPPAPRAKAMLKPKAAKAKPIPKKPAKAALSAKAVLSAKGAPSAKAAPAKAAPQAKKLAAPAKAAAPAKRAAPSKKVAEKKRAAAPKRQPLKKAAAKKPAAPKRPIKKAATKRAAPAKRLAKASKKAGRRR